MNDFDDEEFDGPVKKFMYVNRKAPYGTVYALEGLEVVPVSYTHLTLPTILLV